MSTVDRRPRIQLAWDTAGGDPIPCVTAEDEPLIITRPDGTDVVVPPGTLYIAAEPGSHEINTARSGEHNGH